MLSPIVDIKLKRSFGRVKSRKLLSNDARLITEYFPKVKLNLDDIDFSKARKVCLEIGFGTGTNITGKAELNPDNLYIGCETFINGIAKALAKVESNHLENIKIFHGDARILIKNLPLNLLDEVYILFPDPWPKSKQQKRRLISENFLKDILPLMKNGASLTIATDDDNYASAIIEVLKSNIEIKGCHRVTMPNDWIKTKYQLKAETKNKSINYFLYEKIVK